MSSKTIVQGPTLHIRRRGHPSGRKKLEKSLSTLQGMLEDPIPREITVSSSSSSSSSPSSMVAAVNVEFPTLDEVELRMCDWDQDGFTLLVPRYCDCDCDCGNNSKFPRWSHIAAESSSLDEGEERRVYYDLVRRRTEGSQESSTTLESKNDSLLSSSSS